MRIRRLFGIVMMAALLVAPVGVDAFPQTPAAPDVVTLQIVLTSQGNGKVTTQTHSMELPLDGTAGTLRLGSEVPVAVNGLTVLQQLGTSVDATAKAGPGGLFRIALTITFRALYDNKQAPQVLQLSAGQPVFRNFIVATTALLKDGQSTLATATDILSNETWQANVTLSLKK
jgi:hypothetical protein